MYLTSLRWANGQGESVLDVKEEGINFGWVTERHRQRKDKLDVKEQGLSMADGLYN